MEYQNSLFDAMRTHVGRFLALTALGTRRACRHLGSGDYHLQRAICTLQLSALLLAGRRSNDIRFMILFAHLRGLPSPLRMARFTPLEHLYESLTSPMSRNRKRRRAAYNIHTLDDDEKGSRPTEEIVRHTNYVSIASRISAETSFLDIPGPTGADLDSVDSLPGLVDDDDKSSASGTSGVDFHHQFTEADEEDAEASRRRRTASVRYPLSYA